MRTRATPFPEAPADAVRFVVPWEINLPSGKALLGDDIAAWDFQAVLRLAAAVAVDTAAVRATCHLGDRTTLLVVVTASSSNSKMRGQVFRREVDGPESIPLDVELHGHELGGRLFLDTLLVATGIARLDALSPTAEASIVWRHRKASWLEGESSRFPTEVADLGGAPFFSPGALWYLDIRSDDLDAAALGAVRLVLNENQPTIARILAGDPSAETAAAVSALRWDIARQLITAALDNEEFIGRDGVFEEETLGSMLAGVITLHWPGESPRSLRQLRSLDPGGFERELQDRSGLFRD